MLKPDMKTGVKLKTANIRIAGIYIKGVHLCLLPEKTRLKCSNNAKKISQVALPGMNHILAQYGLGAMAVKYSNIELKNSNRERRKNIILMRALDLVRTLTPKKRQTAPAAIIEILNIKSSRLIVIAP